MSERVLCPQCGGEIPAGSPAGLCPKCLVLAGLESRPADDAKLAPTEPSPQAASSGFVPPTIEELAARFPQLEILELLGRGGMGAVYKARQPGLDRLVAVKILPPEVSADPAFAERFTREARALARLSHPNIVAVYDFGRTSAPLSPAGKGAGGEGAGGEGLFYFVMEYVDGVNLRQAIRSGGMSPKEALAIVPQICDALQFAHDEGIVHRDIKPENVLVDKKGRVKIADFGLAKLLGQAPGDVSLTGTQQVMGTLRYMAPEQMVGTKAVDHRADIYSLGVVFYELLTGEVPVGRFAPPSKKVRIDVRLDEVVLRALEEKPEQRYQHASEVKTRVEEISSTAAPRPTGLRRRATLLLRLSAWTAILVGIFAVALPMAFEAWWPHRYNEHWDISLSPQSDAYRHVWLRGKRELFVWGANGLSARNLIAKRPWTGSAEIELHDRLPNNLAPNVTLEYDQFLEEWTWTTDCGTITSRLITRYREEPQPATVAGWMKEAGIDVTKPGVQGEAAELIRLVKDASSGLLPGGQRPADSDESAQRICPRGAKIGPFTSHGGGDLYWTMQSVGLTYDTVYNVLIVLFLGTWILGIWIIVQRHCRRLAAARETEQRYQQASEVKTEVEQINRAPQTPGAPLAAGAREIGPMTPAFVLKPAVAVLAVGAGAVILGASQCIGWLVKTLGHQPTYANLETSLWAIAGGVTALVGGASMTRMTSYGLALAGSAGALVAGAAFIRPTFTVLAVVVGIWALAVLLSAKGHAAFGFEVEPDRLAAGRDPRRQVRAPAIALLAVGLLYCFGGTMFMRTDLSQVLWEPGVWTWGRTDELAVGAVAWVLGVILLVAAVQMMRLRGYRLAVAGSILAVPIPPLFLVGLPVGIWALVVLRRPDVRAGFSREKLGRPAAAPWPPPAAIAPVAPLPQMLAVAIGLVFGMLLVTIGVLLIPAAFLFASSGPGMLGGLLGSALGCLAGGLGSLAGSWNAYRQLRGQCDLMKMPRWTGLDLSLAVYGLLGLVAVVAGILVRTVPFGLPGSEMARSMPWVAWLLGGLMVFQAALFLLFRVPFVFSMSRDDDSPPQQGRPGRPWAAVIGFVAVAAAVLLSEVVAALQWRSVPSGGPGDAGQPQQAVHSTPIRTFTTDDPTRSSAITAMPDGTWLIDCPSPQTFHLFEMVEPDVDGGMLHYRARLNPARLQGRAYLEMWCRLPGSDEFFSRGFERAVSGPSDDRWVRTETLFRLEPGQRPDLIRLNLVVEGTGRVGIRNVEVCTNAEESSAASAPPVAPP